MFLVIFAVRSTAKITKNIPNHPWPSSYENYLTGEYFWGADSQRSGIIRLWIQQADTNPRIAFVLPTWQVTLDGVDLERKFYEDFNDLKGKEIRLTHGELSFTFQFPV